jgi:NAD(P)-dependent dehydrogenase (short-subunit alcohol dehydrogenase family)
MAFKLLVVIGATGNQGGSVVETFLKEPGWTIRGLTRNVNSDAARTLKERGVEMVSANLDDIYSLRAAFQDAHTIFSVLDFWTGYRNPANHSMLAPGQTMMEWAHDYEMQQGKNVFAAAAQVDGLERLIFSALPYATKWSGGKYTHVYHFDSEARAVEYARAQYPDLVKKTSLIQIGMYLSNMLLMPHYQPKKVRSMFS